MTSIDSYYEINSNTNTTNTELKFDEQLKTQNKNWEKLIAFENQKIISLEVGEGECEKRPISFQNTLNNGMFDVEEKKLN